MPIVAGIIAVVIFLQSVSLVLATSSVVINEFLPAPSSGNFEWVEFYSTESADLSDFYFDDDTDFNSDSGNSPKIALSGILPKETTCYWELSNYLNNNGDKPTLFQVGGILVDTHSYTFSQQNKSYSPDPNGGVLKENVESSLSSVKCIDLVPVVATTPTPDPVETKPTPVFDWQPPEKGILGENFKINLSMKNFVANTEYYLKLRGGLDESHLSKMQTKNGGSYFTDNESWENFPIIKTDSNGNWTGEIWGLLSEDKSEGVYKIKLRVRKKGTDIFTFSESEFKDLKFSKPAEIVIVATPPAVIKSVEKIATKPAVISVKKSTQSAVLGSSVVENNKPPKTNPVAVILGVSGFSLLLLSVWGIIIKRYGS